MKFIAVLFCIGYVAAMPEPKITVEELETNDDAEITEGYLEGDIEVSKDRNAILSHNALWPNGVVYYHISSAYPASTRATIIEALHEIESNTRHAGKDCIKYIERTNQHDYVYIHKGTGCHSHVGRSGGQQEVSIGSGCERKGTIMHELIHALGFHHEQTRYDRDQYVVIHKDNIGASHLHNFNEYSRSQITTLGTTYDYGSVMHYNAYSFAEDRSKPTMSAIGNKAAGISMGQRLAMSHNDVWKIQKLYGCTLDTTHITHPPTSAHVIDCSFDKDMCGLTSDSGNFNWARKSGSTPTSGTGPNADHTNGGGSYIYAEANGHHHQKARLRTAEFPAGSYCLDFYLFQHGSSEGTFQILVSGSRVHEQSVKTVSGDHTNGWYHYRINVNFPSSVHLILQATIGSGDRGDIAVDDFIFYHGRCL